VDTSALRQRIRRLQHEHRADRDSGYEFLESLIRCRSGLGEEDRGRFDEVLLSEVEDTASDLWEDALDALTRARAPGVGGRLLKVLSGTKDPELKDHLVRSLLQLGEDGRPCRDHIEDSFRRDRPEAIQMAALLHRLDPETALTMEAEYLARKLREAGAGDEVRGYIPGLVQQLAETSPEPLAELVRRVAAREPAAAGRLAGMIREYVAKPWAQRSLGAARIEAIRQALS
jgi:hypothetical protein